jgi:predicted ATPase
VRTPMTRPCTCEHPHQRLRIVLTGGPGAGKTAVLELLRQSLCEHVLILRESAGVVFGGGFPRNAAPGVHRAAQRAIYFVQRELECAGEATGASILLCDRGTVDGSAYWTGEDSLWDSVGSTHANELSRYDVVIHLRVPTEHQGYGAQNPLRVESADEARRIDHRIALAWRGHGRLHVVEATANFMAKAERVLAILRDTLPACCLASSTRRASSAARVASAAHAARRGQSRKRRMPSRA